MSKITEGCSVYEAISGVFDCRGVPSDVVVFRPCREDRIDCILRVRLDQCVVRGRIGAKGFPRRVGCLELLGDAR